MSRTAQLDTLCPPFRVTGQESRANVLSPPDEEIRSRGLARGSARDLELASLMNGLQTSARVTNDDERETACLVDPAQHDLVVADASWSWTQRLFAPLADLGVRVLLLKVCDWRTALLQKRPGADWFFPRTQVAPNLWEQSIILPPGWMKSYPALGMRPLTWAVSAWRRKIAPRPQLTLAISYPHYLELQRQLRPQHLIYYNMDDYAFYWKNRAESVRELEREAVTRADISIFCARTRADELTRTVPQAIDRIFHLPHGAPLELIPDRALNRPLAAPSDLAGRPRPLLGFVGSLEDRLDWRLLEIVARRFANATIVLIGRKPAARPHARWWACYKRVEALPNVAFLGWRPAAQIAKYLHSFDICLIPYDVTHPFNRAASPTKLLDYMATTRPVVTTALPECVLYEGLFEIADSPGNFLERLEKLVQDHSDDGKAQARRDHALRATWAHRAGELWRLFSRRLSPTITGEARA